MITTLTPEQAPKIRVGDKFRCLIDRAGGYRDWVHGDAVVFTKRWGNAFKMRNIRLDEGRCFTSREICDHLTAHKSSTMGSSSAQPQLDSSQASVGTSTMGSSTSQVSISPKFKVGDIVTHTARSGVFEIKGIDTSNIGSIWYYAKTVSDLLEIHVQEHNLLASEVVANTGILDQAAEKPVSCNNSVCDCGADSLHGTGCDKIYHADWCGVLK